MMTGPEQVMNRVVRQQGIGSAGSSMVPEILVLADAGPR
jgi:hypothetical protein